MSPSFDQISPTIREPMVAVEFNSTAAQQGPSLLSYRALMIAQKLAAGSAAANSITRVNSVDQVIALAGRGSMAHRDYMAWRENNKSTELWLALLVDDGAGVAAKGTITVTGPADADGTIALYLGGERITIGVNEGDTANDIAAAINTAINAELDLPVTSTVLAAVVSVTYRHKGLVGNSYDMRDSYRAGEALPDGVGLAYVAVGTATAGTTNPDVTDLIAALGDRWFHIWTHPYTDATSLDDIDAELASRWDAMRMIDALAITSAAGTFSALTTLGSGRNSKHQTIVSQPGKNPLTPPSEYAAAVAGVVALYGAQDPGRPFQTLTVNGVLPPAEADEWTFDERNLLLYDGIATTKVGPGNVVQLGRMITTYQESPSGADDTAYLDATTVLTLMFLRYDFRTRIQLRYPRHKLADDEALQYIGSGQAVMTPALGKAEAVTWFEDMMELALVEGLDQFKQDLVCVRSETDPNRLEWLLPPDLMNSLIVAAAQIQFRL